MQFIPQWPVGVNFMISTIILFAHNLFKFLLGLQVSVMTKFN